MPDEKIEKMYDRLMASQNLAGLSAEKALEQIGLLIDLSGDLAREEGTAHALEWADELEKGSLSASDEALLKYFRGNAWANRQQVRRGDRAAAWAWGQPELQQQLLQLRGAVQHEGFRELPDLRQCQIFTNLANQINTVGRFVESQEYWNRALAIKPRFGMALAVADTASLNMHGRFTMRATRASSFGKRTNPYPRHFRTKRSMKAKDMTARKPSSRISGIRSGRAWT